VISSGPDPVVIACGSDARYVEPLAVMLGSTLANLGAGRTAVVYVLDGGIEPHQREELVRSLRERAAVNWVRVRESAFAGAPLWGRMPAATYFKLGVADLLPPTVQKVIWLDSDLVVLRDVGRLWDLELDGRHLLAVQDSIVPLVSSRCGITAHQRLGIPGDAKYFNAGVMVVNVDRWREDEVTTRVLEYLRQHRDNVFFWDQEGLNAVLAGKWGELDPRWNYNTSIPRGRRARAGNGAGRPPGPDEDEPWILHFAGTLKPWLYPGFDRHRSLYYRYLDTTPWAGRRPRPTVVGTMIELYESSRVRDALYPLEQWAMRFVRTLSRRSVRGTGG
jgi:lipopolysaccharide biosynthesis glycosyltransferase